MQMPGRSFSSPAYRYGFNGKEKDGEIKGDGNSLDFGARIYDSRLGRWLSVDVKEGKYPGWSPYHFGYCSPIITIDPNGEENIIIVGSDNGNRAGGTNDATAGRQMREHFITTAANIYNQYAQADTKVPEKTTILLFSTGNNKEDLRLREMAVKKGVPDADIIFVKKASEIVSYVNNREKTDFKTFTNPLTKEPIPQVETYTDKITDLSFVGHGTYQTLFLDNPYVGASADQRISANDFGYSSVSIKPYNFTRNACINLISCRSGYPYNSASDFMKQVENKLRTGITSGNPLLRGAKLGSESYWPNTSGSCDYQGGSQVIQGGSTTDCPKDKEATNINISNDSPR
jgi:RHS repeat-associated protein